MILHGPLSSYTVFYACAASLPRPLSYAMATLPTKESPFQPYTVPKVKLTDTSLGSGAYGSVEEAEITGARCAAKTINERAFPPDDPLEERQMKVAEGCRQWNNLRHPNVVQFLGVYFPELASPIPVLLMEAMSTNLHQFLKSRHRAGCIPLALKISILRDTACGVAYLHGQQPPIVHGRLSAKKVHLDSGMVAKISVDVGITILEQLDLSLYMPPEVTDKKSPRRETIDTFSIGVLAIFTTTEELPERILPTSYTEELKEQVAEHQVNYMEKVHSRFRRSHPLVQLIEKCLSMLPESRPTIEEILSLLWQAGAEIPDPFREKTKAQLAQEMAKQSQEILQIKGDFESHVSYLQSQIEGLFLGMAKQRKMLPCDEDEDSEEVTEQEIAYIVNFLEGIRASDLGVALRITVSSLDIIDFNFLDKHDENRKRVAVLTEWIRNCDSPTWPALIEASITIGQKRMADLINNDKGTHS